MKIACIVDCVSRKAGGMFVSVRRLMQSLAAAGNTVQVFTNNDPYTEEDSRLWAPVPVNVVDSIGPRRLGFAPRFIDGLSTFDPDALSVHGVWTYTSLVSSRWHRTTGRPVIIHPHGMLDPWAVQNSRWKKRLAGWAFEYRHLREAACLRALCQAEADAMRAFGLRNPIAIVPNAIDLPTTSQNTSSLATHPTLSQLFQDRNILLYIGRLHDKKGLVNLIHAWGAAVDPASESRNVSSTWTLAIAGWDEGGHESELQQLATQLGIRWIDIRKPTLSSAPSERAQIAFLGPQYDELKAICYRNCRAFVLPSFSEGLPMAVLEAWAYGKPVLMTPQCNLPIGFDIGAAIRIEPTIDSISAGLRKLLSLDIDINPELRLNPEAQFSQTSRAGEFLGSSNQGALASSELHSPIVRPHAANALQEIGERGRELVEDRFTWPHVGTLMQSVFLWTLGMGPKPDCVTQIS